MSDLAVTMPKVVSKITRILVPHDGSQISDKALDKAIELSKALKSEIIILHIVDDRLIPSGPILAWLWRFTRLEESQMEAFNILKRDAEAKLSDRMKKVKANEINVRLITRLGAPAEEIIEVAENEHVDLIIMGSRELKKEKDYAVTKLKLLGSVARRVSEIAEGSVMIVK